MSDTFHHVRDTGVWELPKFVLDSLGRAEHLMLPNRITKYMVLQLVVVALVLVIFRGLANRIAKGQPAKGIWWNFWEMLAVYIRDQVVRPSIGVPHHDDHHGDHGHGEPSAAVAYVVPVTAAGHSAPPVEVGHPADKYLPFVWSVFFYILFCNLLGAIPFLGSPTADINVCGVLAVVTLAHVAIFGSEREGFGGFLKALVPHMELPWVIELFLWPMLWCIEALGLLIKHFVLAVRLFANIMAGHTVLGVFLSFIAVEQVVANGMLWGVVVPASIFAQVAIGLLELFVAFLQAYVFSMLASLFIGAAVNPH